MYSIKKCYSFWETFSELVIFFRSDEKIMLFPLLYKAEKIESKDVEMKTKLIINLKILSFYIVSILICYKLTIKYKW